MKRISLLLGLLVVVGLSSKTIAQKDRTLSNGFSIQLVTGVPSSLYGLENGDAMPDDAKLSTLWGLQLGNRWYFSPSEKGGIGLMVNWIDFSYSLGSGVSSTLDWARIVTDLTFFEMGPIGTIPLSEQMAVDAYYNLRPTWIISGFGTTLAGQEEAFAGTGFGFSHAIGAAFRYQVLSVGVEYVVGGINSTIVDANNTSAELGTSKLKTNSLRFNIGVKF